MRRNAGIPVALNRGNERYMSAPGTQYRGRRSGERHASNENSARYGTQQRKRNRQRGKDEAQATQRLQRRVPCPLPKPTMVMEVAIQNG